MTEKKTLRLCCPQWQGGVNPNYVFGAELLSVIAPPSGKDETVAIPVAREFNAPVETMDGIDWGGVLLSQMNGVRQTLEEKRPDRLIVFGGDCSVTQVPFDYLSGKYGGDLGILWLDAHPDISSPGMTSHLHEMPLSNLLGRNPGSEITRVHHPFPAEKVFMAGLIEERLRPMDQACRDLHLRTASPEALARGSEPVSNRHLHSPVRAPRGEGNLYSAVPLLKSLSDLLRPISRRQTAEASFTVVLFPLLCLSPLPDHGSTLGEAACWNSLASGFTYWRTGSGWNCTS